MGWSSIPKVPKTARSQNISKNEVREEVEFLHEDRHQSFLQVNFNTLGIKVSYKVIPPLLMVMIKYSVKPKLTSLQYV